MTLDPGSSDDQLFGDDVAPPLPPPPDWTSPSKVAKTLNPGEGLLRWANQQGLKGVPLAVARKPGTGAGLSVHSFLERLTAGEDPDVVEAAAAPLQAPTGSYVRGLCGWWREQRPVVLFTEEKVASERLRVRGRIDLVRACTRLGCECYGEGAVISDAKTGGLTAYVESHLQAATYREMWPDVGLRPEHLCGVELVCLDDRARWNVEPCSVTREQLLAVLAAHRAHQQVVEQLRLLRA